MMDYGPGVDSASNRNKYQEHFLSGKGDQCTELTTIPLSCADYLEILDISLNLLEPSGPVISLYFFLDVNECLAAHPGCFVPGNKPLITNGQEAGWASELAQTWCGR